MSEPTALSSVTASDVPEGIVISRSTALESAPFVAEAAVFGVVPAGSETVFAATGVELPPPQASVAAHRPAAQSIGNGVKLWFFIGLSPDCAKNPPLSGFRQGVRNVELAHIP